MSAIVTDQTGCGYCSYEKVCIIRNREVNWARMGCPCFRHYMSPEFGEGYSDERVEAFKARMIDVKLHP